jgi:hypothetical protein
MGTVITTAPTEVARRLLQGNLIGDETRHGRLLGGIEAGSRVMSESVTK